MKAFSLLRPPEYLTHYSSVFSTHFQSIQFHMRFSSERVGCCFQYFVEQVLLRYMIILIALPFLSSSTSLRLTVKDSAQTNN
jgi:hypothetical protein